jgi:hypothetical protein
MCVHVRVPVYSFLAAFDGVCELTAESFTQGGGGGSGCMCMGGRKRERERKREGRGRDLMHDCDG